MNTKTPTIQELKNKGFSIEILHYRLPDSVWRTKTKKEIKKNYGIYLMGNNILDGRDRAPFGGRTEIKMKSPDGKEIKTIVVCSVNDQFCRKKALAIGLGRALTQLNQLYES